MGRKRAQLTISDDLGWVCLLDHKRAELTRAPRTEAQSDDDQAILNAYTAEIRAGP